MTNCPSCNTNNADEAAFCKSCGRPLASAVAVEPGVVVEEVVASETVVVTETAVAPEPVPAGVAQPTVASQPVAQPYVQQVQPDAQPAPYNASQQQYAAQPAQAQPTYQQPTQPFAQQTNYYAPAAPANGKATASLILGIISLALVVFLFCVPFLNVISIITGIIGLVMGLGSRKISKEGKATAGIIMSAIALTLSVIITAFWIWIIVIAVDSYSTYEFNRELNRLLDI
jgi:hypothetical protein